MLSAIYAAGPNAGIGEGKSSIRSLPAGIKVSMAAGATLDLNLRNQTVAEFAGEGAIVNGALAAAKYTLTGPLAVQDDLALPANVTLDYTSEAASLQVAGKLALPAAGMAKVALSDKPGRKAMTLFSSGTPVDWANALKGWQIILPDPKTWEAVPVSTPNSFGYTFKRIGFVLLVR